MGFLACFVRRFREPLRIYSRRTTWAGFPVRPDTTCLISNRLFTSCEYTVYPKIANMSKKCLLRQIKPFRFAKVSRSNAYLDYLWKTLYNIKKPRTRRGLKTLYIEALRASGQDRLCAGSDWGAPAQPAEHRIRTCHRHLRHRGYHRSRNHRYHRHQYSESQP